MLTVKNSFVLTLATACLPFALGCIQEGDEADQPSAETESAESDLVDIDPALFYDGCKSVAPDQTYYLTSATGAISAPSPHGGYGYDNADFCGRWVVDFKFGTAAPKRLLSGRPYDLPSSSAALGTWPANAVDCSRLRVSTTIYRKKSTETTFTVLTSKVATGIWQSGSCYAPVASATALPSTSGWDTYRVAVATKLRASWQQTAASADYPPPS